MAISKAERWMDLVIALLHAPRHRTAAWVRSNVAGYAEARSDDAFNRMFERDKQELRELGIPIETAPDGDGYRIPARDFALPPLQLTPPESAALAVAARLWEATVLADAGGSGLRKVRDGSAEAHTELGERAPGPDRLQARIRTREPSFQPLFTAIRARRPVTFAYWGKADTGTSQRHVEPWGLANVRGSWYLVGHDRDRGATRTFRLSRIHGAVTTAGPAGTVRIPADLDVLALAADQAGDDGAPATALLRIKRGSAAGLRRIGTVIGTSGTGEFDEVRVPVGTVVDLARRVAAHGPDVVAVDPQELRQAVRELLAGAAQ